MPRPRRCTCVGAREIACALGDARFDPYGTGFRSSNVDIHSVSVPVELSDATTAVARAVELHLPPGTAPSRVGHHHIDVSRAWLLHGCRDRAFAERHRNDTLAGYARWAGVRW
ncbi:MAG: hypothetical protein ACRDRH_17865 [Pseudonocardia sp.]